MTICGKGGEGCESALVNNFVGVCECVYGREAAHPGVRNSDVRTAVVAGEHGCRPLDSSEKASSVGGGRNGAGGPRRGNAGDKLASPTEGVRVGIDGRGHFRREVTPRGHV